MKTTTSNLMRGAGLSAMVAGIIFAVVGLIHPPEILSSLTTGTWTIVHSLTIAMSFFGLLGIAGIYARQAEEAGALGLAGFVLLSLWFVVVTGFTFFEAFMLPLLAYYRATSSWRSQAHQFHGSDRSADALRSRHGQTRTMTEVTASISTLPSTSRPDPRRTNTPTQWLAPVGLIVLSLIPVLGGAGRLTELTGGPEITANNARFLASPIPVTVHIVSVTVYSLLGALQFVPSLRRGRPSWHRIAGCILVPAGVLVALSGLWMTVFYPRPAGDGEVLLVVRLIFGSAMLASIVLAVLAIRRRDFPSHGAWMTRGYAIALGAGTQVFTLLPWILLFGPIGAADELPRAVLMTAGWVINVAVAEYVIRRSTRRSGRTSAGLGQPGTADTLAA